MLLTKDEDFMDMARRGVLMSPLVWIRSGNMTTDRPWQLLAPVLADIEAAVAGGETVIEVR